MAAILCIVIYGFLLVWTIKIGREAGISPLLCILGTVIAGPLMLLFVLLRRPKKDARQRFDKEEEPSGFWDKYDLEDLQRGVTVLLYISLISHSLTLLLADLDILVGLIPVLGVITVVSATLYFLMEAMIVPPLVLLILTAVSAVLFLVVPYIVAMVLGVAVSGLIMLVFGGLLAAATMGVVVTMVNGVVTSVALAPMITLPMIMGGATVGATAVVGAGVAAGMDAGMRQFEPSGTMVRRRILVNLLLLVVLVWPVLSLVGAFQGIFGMKPMVRQRREHLIFNKRNEATLYRAFFDNPEDGTYMNGEKNWTFGEGFYDSYIYPGRNTFAQGTYPSASSGSNIAFCLNGMIYLHNAESNEIYRSVVYDAGPEDAMVMVGEEAFLFGDDRILLMGPDGQCKWTDTRWRTDFRKLSREEQYDRLYAVLEAQNDGRAGTIGIEDVAVVAYAQRIGLLMYYDAETHCAYFGQENKAGDITILRQNAGGRTELTTFSPSCDSDNLPYTMINASTVAYIKGSDIFFRGVEEDWVSCHYSNQTHNGESHPFVSLHVLHDEEGTEFFAYVDSEDILCVERLGDVVREVKFDTKHYNGIYSVGTDIFCIVYDNNLLSRLTYIQDRYEDQTILDVCTEKWTWSRVRITNDLWDPKEPVKTIPWEELPFDVRYAPPELNTGARQGGLYKDNVASPTEYGYYRGPVDNFSFRYPRILYDEVAYTWSEDETEVCIRLYCNDDPSSLTVTLRPNAGGLDHQTLIADLLEVAKEEMSSEKTVRSGLDNEEGTASSFFLRGYAADSDDLICARVCRVDSEYIMEMELRIPRATSDEDEAYKEFYIMAMEAVCGFGSGDDYEPFWKFKKDYID